MMIIDHTLIRDTDPLIEFCGFCGRPVVVCDDDAHGCGTTPAEDEQVKTWRDQPPML